MPLENQAHVAQLPVEYVVSGAPALPTNAGSPEAPVPLGLGFLTADSYSEWGELQEERLPLLGLPW